MSATRRIATLAGLLSLMAMGASAYSHWVFIASPGGAYQPVPGRFDLNALRDNTVQYFISDSGPSVLMPGDTMTAVRSQIQQAASVWNRVPGSALRVRFGGVSSMSLAQSTSGIDVIFDDEMPPGIVAQTAPSFPVDLTLLSAEGTTFVPIVRSRIQLRRDLTVPGYEQPSYADHFFLTLVHEFGHALGLQHSLTSSVMSTGITRASKRGTPLAQDDVAAISLLYPAPGFAASTGSISGQVMLGDAPVNMASVVAISTDGTAVGTLTNINGTYRIDGLPEGQYSIYAHPLPPAQLGETSPAAIVPPVDLSGTSYPAFTGFDTRFYPGTRDWTQATPVDVAAGGLVEHIDFAVEARDGPAIYDMQVYGYQGSVPVSSPPLQADGRYSIVFYAPGTTVDQQSAMAPGLSVSVIEGPAVIEEGSLRYYTQGYMLMTVATAAVDRSTPVALAVTLGNELYVLPSAFFVEPAAPPSIDTVTPVTDADGNTTAAVTGSNLSARTRYLFDGVPGRVISLDDSGGAMIQPPRAPSGHQAVVEAVNPDGQTSLQALDAAHLPVYIYPQRDDATIAVDQAFVQTGTDGLVAISGLNTHFTQGWTRVGLGSSDVSVRRTWVLDANHLMLNLTVNPGASIGPTDVTVSTGLELMTVPAGIQVTPGTDPTVSLRAPVLNAATGLAGVPVGGTVLIPSTGLPLEHEGWTLQIGGIDTPFTLDDGGVISAQVPADLALGPQTVQLLSPAGPVVPPILLQLDLPPPVITLAAHDNPDGGDMFPIMWFTPATGGETVVLAVEGLGEAAQNDMDDTFLTVGEARVGFTLSPGESGKTLLRFVLPQGLPYNPDVTAQSTTLHLQSATRRSEAFTLMIHLDPPPPADPPSDTPSQ